MYIDSLELENIKAFQSLKFDFKRPNSESYAGLNVFVGGNASGKSTLLKAMAMGLLGPQRIPYVLDTPISWISHEQTKANISFCEPPDIQDRISKYSVSFVNNNAQVNLTSRVTKGRRAGSTIHSTEIWEDGEWIWVTYLEEFSAYGPLRRLTGSSLEAERYANTSIANCITLLREDAALAESELWLRQQHARMLEDISEKRDTSPIVKEVCDFLNDGLFPDGFAIERVTVDRVYMKTPNGAILPLSDLSDGYRITFALILDIIFGILADIKRLYKIDVYTGLPSIFAKDAEGRIVVDRERIVLIDELESHLHPSWQQKICVWLKTRFPKVQFFITTHSPLIAQCADEGGLYVLPLPNEVANGGTARRLSPSEQEQVRLGSTDSVLLGEAFGLEYAWSTETQKLVERWRTLSQKKHAYKTLSEPELSEYRDLKRKIAITFNTDSED